MSIETDQAAASIARMAESAAAAVTKTAAAAAATVVQVANDANASLTPVLVAIGKIETKLDIYIDQHRDYKKESDVKFEELWKAVDLLKAKNDTSSGYSAGQRAVWAIIGALPPGVALAILGMMK